MKKAKSKYADGGPIQVGMPTTRPSSYSIGPLQFGGGQDGNMAGMLQSRPRLAEMAQRLRANPVRAGRPGPLPANPRVQPAAPKPVGPGGGYKKGGRIDGCAMKGKTKGKSK